MNATERKDAIAALEARLSHDKRVHRGRVADRNGLKSWMRAASTTETEDFDRLPKPVQQRVLAQRASEEAEIAAFQAEMKAKVESNRLRRRSPRTRVEVLTAQLIAEAERTYAATGQVVFPESVMREIQADYWRKGHMEMTLDGIREQLRAYAERLMNRAATDHAAVHGHRNEGVSLVGGVLT